MTNLFLLLGMARSGTTLAQRLLVESGVVHIPRETHFWSDNQFPSSFDVMTSSDIDDALRRLAQREFDVSGELERQLRLLAGRTAWEFFDALVRGGAPNTAVLCGEKTPSHTQLIEKLHSEHEGLRSIVMVRDPRATFTSHLSVPWGNHDSNSFIGRWRKTYQQVVLSQETYGADRVKIIRLEDLVHETQHQIDSTLSFLSVNAVDQDARKPKQSDLASPTEFWKDRSFGEVEAAPDNRFRFRLDPREERRFATSLSDLMEFFGY